MREGGWPLFAEEEARRWGTGWNGLSRGCVLSCESGASDWSWGQLLPAERSIGKGGPSLLILLLFGASFHGLGSEDSRLYSVHFPEAPEPRDVEI